MMNKRISTCIAVVVPAIAGVAVIAYSVLALQHYGIGVFMGTPFFVGMSAAYIQSLLQKRTLVASVLTGLGAIGLMGLGVLLVAIDGALCILMSMPLAAAVGFWGALAGFLLGRVGSPRVGKGTNLALFVAIPVLMTSENGIMEHAPERSVTTFLEISADAGTVWHNVIQFSSIDAAPSGIFKFGIAYPLGAHLEGQGVGATRYCEFSTGSFVEPIRIWNEPELLAFDVVRNPVPMREWSIYKDLEVPHLDHIFVSNRGEFRLKRQGDATVLHGSTWYTQAMWPQWYWGSIADSIVHRIHLRVLKHIKKSAEESTRSDPVDVSLRRDQSGLRQAVAAKV